jgi:hypothetical protein
VECVCAMGVVGVCVRWRCPTAAEGERGRAACGGKVGTQASPPARSVWAGRPAWTADTAGGGRGGCGGGRDGKTAGGRLQRLRGRRGARTAQCTSGGMRSSQISRRVFKAAPRMHSRGGRPASIDSGKGAQCCRCSEAKPSWRAPLPNSAFGGRRSAKWWDAKIGRSQNKSGAADIGRSTGAN